MKIENKCIKLGAFSIFYDKIFHMEL